MRKIIPWKDRAMEIRTMIARVWKNPRSTAKECSEVDRIYLDFIELVDAEGYNRGIQRISESMRGIIFNESPAAGAGWNPPK